MASQTPRLARNSRRVSISRSSSERSASAAVRGSSGSRQKPERPPRRCARQGSPCRAAAASIPSASSAPSAAVRSNAAWRVHVRERRDDGRERERVGVGRPAGRDPRHAAVRVAVALEVVAEVGGHPVRADGHAAAEALAERDHVRLEPPRARAAAVGDGLRVGLVQDQQRAVLAREPADLGVEAGHGQHDADVRQRGLRDHGGDLVAREHARERVRVVEGHDPRVGRRARVQAEVAGARAVRVARRRACRRDGRGSGRRRRRSPRARCGAARAGSPPGSRRRPRA